MQSSERASLAEVARLAEVSMGTVSNVLNHPERVKPATRARVEAAIAKLRFTPHGPARSLASGAVPAVGLILSDLANSFFVDVGRGVERVVAERRAFVYIANTESDLEREKQYLRMFRESRLLGNIITLNDDRHYRQIAADDPGDTPLVLLNHRTDDVRHCTVHPDNHRGGQIAAEHVIALGRRRIALVTGPTALQPVAERVDGFAAVVAQTAASIVADHPVAELTRSYGFEAGLALAPRVAAGEVDAIFAVADLVAAGVVQGLASAEPTLRVPGDVAIVGYDDNREAWDGPVQLTTIRQPGEEMGAEGARRLFDELGNDAHEHTATALEPSLVVRASTSLASS